MKELTDFLSGLGVYALPALIVLIEIIAAAVMTSAYLAVRAKNKRIEAELKNERLFGSLLTESGIQAQLLLRRDDRCPVFIAGDLKGLTGIDPIDVRYDPERVKDALADGVYREFSAAYREWDGAKPFTYEFQSGGGERRIRLTATRNGVSDLDLFIFNDVTEDAERINRLKESLEEARRSGDSKTTFLSRMSHEIRTPMNGIIGMLTLAEHRLDEDSPVMQYLAKADSLSQYMLSLINDILDMSRIEAGKVELEKKTFDIFALADRLETMFRKGVEEKGVAFKVELIDFTEQYFVGDEMRINQIIINFLSNAQKFTSEGEITVTFRQMLLENSSADIMIRIHDTGIGMSREFLSHIFRPFEQENVGVTKKYGGSGLGMAITDQLVKLMGGKIVIDTMPGKGSDFMIYLTLPAAEKPTESRAEEIDGESDFTYDGMRILLAEDNDINAEIAIEILQMDGAEVDRAADGREAVDMFASSPEGYYDIILMDIQMPVLDGREATVEIRRMNRNDSDEIPIFALSADAFVEDERYSLQVGMNGHFAKPIDFELLRKGIEKAMRKKNR